MRGRISLLFLFIFVTYGCTSLRPPRQKGEVMHGTASWYGQEFAGRTTANGEIFDPLLYTAAHRTLPFGTMLEVRNPQTGQTVRVRVNDRGPYIGNRVIDLSYAAAQQISLIQSGSGDVDLKVLKLGAGDREPPAPYVVNIADSRTTPDTGAPPEVAFPLPQAAPKPAVVAVTPPVPVVEAPVETVTENADFSSSAATETAPPVEPTAEPPAAEPEPAHISEHVVSPDAGLASRLEPARTGKGKLRQPVVISTPMPSARPASVSRPTSGRFLVQVGAFSVEQNARQLQDQLTRIGQQSHIEHEDLFRVRLGPYRSRDEAVKVRSTLESRGISAIVMAE
jgi:rare lipoprotein A